MGRCSVLADRHVWERAEIERSDCEASFTGDDRLVASPANMRRYASPPATTVYPLEYSYALLGNLAGKTVLDFGCGSGENCLLLARRGARVIGVDISKSLIRIAVRRMAINGRAGAASFVVGSAYDVPLPDASVDIVLGIAILHHLDLAATSREVHRLLKPGGRAIFQEPVRDSRLVRVARSLIPYRAPDISPFERPLTTKELKAFSAPFRRHTMRAFSLPFVNLTQAVAPLRRFIHSAYHLDGVLIRNLPVLEPLTGIRVLEVTK